MLDPSLCHREVVRVSLYANAMSTVSRCSDIGRSCAHEGVQDCVSYKTEHADQPFSQFKRERCWVIFCRCAGKPMPNLLKPFLMFVRGYYAQDSFGNRRSSVAPGLSLHQDIFDVVLDDGVRLEWFPE